MVPTSHRGAVTRSAIAPFAGSTGGASDSSSYFEVFTGESTRSRNESSFRNNSRNLIRRMPVEVRHFRQILSMLCCTVSVVPLGEHRTPSRTTSSLLFVIKVIRKTRVALLWRIMRGATRRTSVCPGSVHFALERDVYRRLIAFFRGFCRFTRILGPRSFVAFPGVPPFFRRPRPKCCRNGNRRSRFILPRGRGTRERIHTCTCALARSP